jgi:low affinity Fe/Cu permease
MSGFTKFFTKFATAVSKWTGRPLVFVSCGVLVILWALSGPIFKFSDTWQLVINTSTTIITFLMIFVLQNSQNRDGKALQAKLDELILTSKAQNKFIGIEKLDEKELKRFHELIEEEAAERAEERGEKPEEHNDERQARQAPFQTVTKQAS